MQKRGTFGHPGEILIIPENGAATPQSKKEDDLHVTGVQTLIPILLITLLRIKTEFEFIFRGRPAALFDQN